MKTLLASTCLVFGILGSASVSNAAECGSVTVASMNWQSAEVLSALDKVILSKGYGCDVSVTVGDTVPTLTSMSEKGEPDIAPEAWIGLTPEVVKRGTDEGRIMTTVEALPDGGQQGWWIPKYIADAHPDIKTIPDMLKHKELFPDPEDPSKGAVFNGPQGWGGTVVTAQYYKAYDAKKAGFNLIDTGSAAGLDGSIAKAYERKQGWVGYYWAPTALLGKYPMVKLESGVEYNADEWKRCNTVADCPDPKPNTWMTDKVYTVVSTKFAKRVDPTVMEYLKKRAWKNETVNKLMAWMTDNQASGEEGAKHFLKENADIWTKWVSPEAEKKIKASL